MLWHYNNVYSDVKYTLLIKYHRQVDKKKTNYNKAIKKSSLMKCSNVGYFLYCMLFSGSLMAATLICSYLRWQCNQTQKDSTKTVIPYILTIVSTTVII